MLLALLSGGVASAQVPAGSRVLRLEPIDGHAVSPVVTAMAVDPLGQVLVAAGDDHSIRVLDLQTLAQRQVLRQHHGWVRSLDFRRDGRRMVSAGNDGQIVFWQGRDEWSTAQVLDKAPAIACVRYSSRGDLLAAVGFDPQLFLLQPATARRPVLHCGCNDMRVVEFNEDDTLVVAAGRSGDVHCFDPATGESAGDFALHSGRVRDLTFMPGSSLLVSVSEDQKVVVFDSRQGRVLHTIPAGGGKLFAVEALDSTRVAVGGADNLVRIVDISRGSVIQALPGHDGSVAVLATSDGYLFSGSFDATIRRWSIDQILQTPRTVQLPDPETAPQR